jgi:RNA polymerase sigma-70 factor (ECF subfamily)
MRPTAMAQDIPIEEKVSSVSEGALADEILVDRARRNDAPAFELLMRRHNQRVYRVVRSVLRAPAEIEDVMQQAYVSAFTHLDQFTGAAKWSTWVCRIAWNEALARLRQKGKFVSIDSVAEDELATHWKAGDMDPEQTAADREFTQLVAADIDRLPDIYRMVLIMREIEGMSTADTAAVLDVEEDVVKTRLLRARAALRGTVEKRIGEQIGEAFSFGNERCDRVVAAVLARIAGLG